MKKLWTKKTPPSNQPPDPEDVEAREAAAMVYAVSADQLSATQQRGLAGLCALLLPRVHDGSLDRAWSQAFLRLVVERFLQLSHDQVDAYLPMLTAEQTMDPAPFASLLVPEKRRSWLHRITHKKPKDKDASNQIDAGAATPSPSPGKPASGSASSPNAELTIDPKEITDAVFRAKLLSQLLWFTVHSAGYDARVRTLLRHLALALQVEWTAITQEEVAIGRALFAEATALPLEKRKAKPDIWDWKRNAAIGAAAVTGGALLAITGGLAAPAIAASLTALGGTGIVIGTAVGSTAGVTATTILFGTAGAGVVGMKTDTRTRGVHEFHFDLVTSGDGMNVYVCVSGWLDDDDPPAKGFRCAWGDSREYLREFYRQRNPSKVEQVDQVLDRYKGREHEFFRILRNTYRIDEGDDEEDPLGMRPRASSSRKSIFSRRSKSGEASSVTAAAPPVDQAVTSDLTAMRAWRWKDRVPQGDQYCLMWEEALLRKFGKSMRSFATEQMLSYANTEIVKYTALAALFAAVALPRAILKMVDMIDNIWVLMMNNADASGKLLAEALRNREQGLRPVTLIGYGMGARLIFSCLKELAKDPEKGSGLVENAVLLGSPVPVVTQEWTNARSVVSGRLINGYSENDWMLGIMYRYQGWALNSAGIAPLNIAGVENVNLSELISGHLEYKYKIGAILDLLQLDG